MTIDTTTPETVAAPAAAKRTWQDVLTRSASLHTKSAEDKKKSATLLWSGAKTGIKEWLPTADVDVAAERFQSEVMDILGKSRKGDVSKIRTVALAVKNKGLNLDATFSTGRKAGQPQFGSLASAYAEALRLTKTAAAEKDEDTAAEKAVAALADDAPNSTSTPEGAAKIVLAQGLDEAARLLLDALGADNNPAHRSLLRALSAEVVGRVKPKAAPKAAAGPKAGATQAKAGAKTTAKAAPVKAATKPKQAATGTKAAPAKAAPAKASPVQKAKPVTNIGDIKAAPVNAGVEVGTQPKKTAAPVVKRPATIKRG